MTRDTAISISHRDPQILTGSTNCHEIGQGSNMIDI
jgi:hypothetical protein